MKSARSMVWTVTSAPTVESETLSYFQKAPKSSLKSLTRETPSLLRRIFPGEGPPPALGERGERGLRGWRRLPFTLFFYFGKQTNKMRNSPQISSLILLFLVGYLRPPTSSLGRSRRCARPCRGRRRPLCFLQLCSPATEGFFSGPSHIIARASFVSWGFEIFLLFQAVYEV